VKASRATRWLVLFGAVSVIGCGHDAARPKLNFKGVGFNENRAPMHFGLRLEDGGDSTVGVTSVRVLITDDLLMTSAVNPSSRAVRAPHLSAGQRDWPGRQLRSAR
jgi:hypothetical protein